MANKVEKLPARDERPWAWLDEYRGKDFTGEMPTLSQLFMINCKRFESRPCFVSYNPVELKFTYGEARDTVIKIASYLKSQGVGYNDHIGVSGKNSPEWALAYLGILYSGATVVPLDYSLHANEMEKLIAFGDVTRLFIDAERIESIDPDNKLLKEKIALEPSSSYKYVLDIDGTDHSNFDATKSDDVAAILFTSGTTGTPKGVMLTNDNLVWDTLLAQCYMPLSKNDVFYAILPIHHAYTMTAVFLETISCGASLVFGKKLVVSQMLKEMKKGGVTMFLGVPMLFNKLLAGIMANVEKQGKFKAGLVHAMMSFSGFVKKAFGINIGKKLFSKMILSKVSLDTNRICISGGGPLPAETFRKFNQLGIDFVQGYGLTETSPITHLNPVDGYDENSIGKLFPTLEQKIVDPDSDGNGLLYIRGRVVMKGYYKNDDATREVLSPDGWLNTGDMGHIDQDNYLYLTGRAKSIIVTTGGKNVFPEEIEDKFQLYNEIQQICIIGYTVDKKMKIEGIRAVIYPAKDFVNSQNGDRVAIEKRMNEIVDEVNRKMQAYRQITMVTVADEPLEVTSTQKIKRFEVAKKYAL